MIKPRHIVKHIDGDYRLIAISDIHGHLDRFKLLLKQINYTPEDYLIIIGDFVEKGDQVIETIHFVQELDQNERTYVLLGNCEWALYAMLTITELADQIPKYLIRVPTNGCIRQLYNELHLYDGHVTTLGVQKVLRNYLEEELKYIYTLPTTLKFNDYLFVHAGIEPRKDYQRCGLSSMLEMQRFLDMGHLLDETVIVGHLPTSNYRDTINNDIIYDKDKKIICIDGGTGVKPISQLNALIIESHQGNITINDDYVQDFHEYSIIKDQISNQLVSHKIAYPDYEITIITKGKEFSYCLHNSSSINLYIKNEFIYIKNDKYYCLDDYCDLLLDVKVGDMIKLIDIYGDWAYVIKNKVVGWVKIDCINFQ